MEPTTNTPPYTWWINATNAYGGTAWMIQGSQTLLLCRDITITWTTTPGKLYSVETGWNNGQPWVTLLPPTPASTNRMAFRTGTKYAVHYFRVRIWP